MNNFIFQNPTRLLFGKGMIAKITQEIPQNKTIMVTFGGGSVKRNGVYNQVSEALKNHHTIEFWGIESNPDIDTLKKAIQEGKEKNIDYLLAVGGGSVIDGTKLIVAGLCYDGDAWDLVCQPSLITKAVPFASVLTIPATGSEMNSGGVISSRQRKEKRSFGSPYTFPVFSVLDPETTYSLPKHHLACGLVDTFVHVMEQYMTTPHQSSVMDRWAEGVLHTVIEIAPQIIQNPTDYDLMANFMFSATMGLNGFLGMGVTEDWSTHMIGHELTALHGLTHGHSLAIVLPGTLRVLREQKREKIIQYAERIWNISEKNPDKKIDQAIEQTEQFFRSLGLTTRLSEEGIGEDTIDKVENRFNEKKVAYGECNNVTGTVAKQILKSVM